MNKKPIDTILQHTNFNDKLFKQSIGIVQSTKNITPISKIPLQMMKQSSALQIKKKQQLIQTHLSKSVKLFGQILGVKRNSSFGTMNDYATEIFDELTDLIQTSCQAFVEKKKNIKAIEKEKELSKEQNDQNNNNAGKNVNSNRPQDKYPSIKPALFDHHTHTCPSQQKIKTHCQKVRLSFPINQPLSYIDTRDKLQKMIAQLRQCTQIAVDLQHSSKSYEGFTCLIQISSRHKDYIVDVFPIWQHIHLLKGLIENQDIIKVMHGAEMDSKWLQRDFNIHIVNLFDTYKASRVLGYPKFSYAYLLHHYCDTSTDKTYQLADWRQRPLTPQMIQYARIDTHYLLQIWDKLLQDLTKQSVSMNLDPSNTIKQIYKSSYDVSLSQIQLFSYTKKQLYQNVKNDIRAQDFDIIQTVFWVIDKVAREQDEAFDDLINRRTLTDVIGRVRDLILNKRATIDMLRVKIDRLIAVIKSHKHQKVALLLNPLKKELQKYFLEPKKQVQSVARKRVKLNASQPSLLQKIDEQKTRDSKKQNIPLTKSTHKIDTQQAFTYQKPSLMIQQLDYPLKTYQNYSLQQHITHNTNNSAVNKKPQSINLIKFQPIMTFLSQRFNISQKKAQQQQQDQQNNLQNDSQNDNEIQLQNQNLDEKQGNQAQTKQNQGFLEFKRIKPNVIYTIQQEQVEQNNNNRNTQKKTKKKRKEEEYEQKLRNKEGNIYDMLVGDQEEEGEMRR